MKHRILVTVEGARDEVDALHEVELALQNGKTRKALTFEATSYRAFAARQRGRNKRRRVIERRNTGG